MDYYGLLFLYYLKGLSGKSVLKLFFNVGTGGTEQLLPENTSTPTTSPLLADIQYPDGLRTDQYFTYRETPTTVSNKARIKTIKGNTLVWNQLVQNGNFVDTSLWRTYASTGFSVSNNVGLFTVTGSTGAIYQTNTPTYVSGHKYLVITDFYVSQQSNISVEVSGTRGKTETINANTWYRYSDIVAPSAQGNFSLTCGQASVQVKNVMCFDLTQMGLDSITADEFTSLFPLSYYAYNQGSLLSFNGNGIKTVGKNLVFKTITNSSINGSGVIISTSNFQMSVASVIKGKEYVITTNDNSKKVLGFYYEEPVVGSVSYNGERVDDSSSYTFTSPITGYVAFRSLGGYSTPMLEFGSVATDYEPYTSSTLSLPISTYFPTGMKSAGNVYDELTESKAITRVGTVTLNGTEIWHAPDSSENCWMDFRDMKTSTDYTQTMTATVTVVKNRKSMVSNSVTGYDQGTLNYLYFRTADATQSVENVKAYLQANPVTFNYELKTPTETPITTEDANEALSLLMGKSVSSNNAKQMIDIITKGE